jgi:hypothetical protein
MGTLRHHRPFISFKENRKILVHYLVQRRRAERSSVRSAPPIHVKRLDLQRIFASATIPRGMHLNKALFLLLAGVQFGYSTVVLVGTSKDGIVMAADKREIAPNKPPNDTYTKVTSLGKFAAFASLGEAPRLRNKRTGRIEFDADAYTKKALQDKRISKEQLQQFGTQLGQAMLNVSSTHKCEVPPLELIFAQAEGNSQVLYKLILENCTPTAPEVYPLAKGDGGHIAYNDLMFGSAVDSMNQFKSRSGPFYERIKNNKELVQFLESGEKVPVLDPSGAAICHAYQLFISSVGATSDSSSTASDCVVINKTSGLTWNRSAAVKPQGQGK